MKKDSRSSLARTIRLGLTVVLALLCLAKTSSSWSRPRDPRAVWADFTSRHPNWTVEWNEDGTPRRALGGGIPIGRNLDEGTAVTAALEFVDAHRDLIGIGSEELSLLGSYGGGRLIYVLFAQVHRGIPVAGSQVDFRIQPRGVLSSFGARGLVLGLDVDPTPALPAADAFDILLDRLCNDSTQPAIGPDTAFRFEESDLSIHREARDGVARGRLAWRVRLTTDSPFGNWVGFVDSQTGDLIRASNEIYGADVVGTVDARALVTGACFNSPLDVVALPHLRVRVSGGSASHTDATGAFVIGSSATEPVTVIASLDGRWVNVNNSGNTDLQLSATATPGVPVPLRFLPVGASELDLAQVNAYVHTTAIHDFVRQVASVPGIDRALTCRVNLMDTCNAFYSTNMISFFRSGGGCSNSASASVIAHEYGHFLDDQTGGIENAALSEGNGDVLSLLYTGDPCEWRCIRPSRSDLCARDNAVGRVWPAAECGGEPHCVGQTFAGYAWDAREALISELGLVPGARLANEVFIATFLANPASIPDAVLETFLADDDDGELSNGTPHGEALAQAATQHGFQAPIPPTIGSASPGSGGLCGGDEVVLAGSAFDRSATTVRFDGVAATIVSVSPSGTRIAVLSPPGTSERLASITVTTPFGSATLADAFAYANVRDASIRGGSLRVGGGATLDVVGTPHADFVVLAGLQALGSTIYGVGLTPGPARIAADSVQGSDARTSACGVFSKSLQVPARPSLASRQIYLQGAIREGSVLRPAPLHTYTIDP